MKKVYNSKTKKADLLAIIKGYETEVETLQKVVSDQREKLLTEDELQDIERAELGAEKLELWNQLSLARAWRNVAWAILSVAVIFIAMFMWPVQQAEAHFQPGRPLHNFCHVHPRRPICERPTRPEKPTPVESESEGPVVRRSGERRQLGKAMMLKMLLAQRAYENEHQEG